MRLSTGGRFLAAVSRYLLFACALASFAFSGSAHAQNAEGTLGWKWLSNYYPTAYEACRAQWLGVMNNGYSRFIGDEEDGDDDWTTRDCEWTRFQYLCPAETGGGFACGTILPDNVHFYCETGYTPTVDEHCRENPAVERPCYCDDEYGRENPTIGNPIVLSTGAKILVALDFETADGDFRIGRHYRTFQVGRPIDGKILPRGLPRGLIGGWNFDFGHEIQLGTFSGSPSSPNAKVGILLPDGTGFGFVLQSNGQWAPDPALGAANKPNYLKLEFVGTLPSNLADIRSASSTWRLTDRDDTVWTLQTRNGPNGGQYLKGWVTQMVRRDGYQWTFAYNSDSSLASITDSFGRAATFTWHKFFISSLGSPPSGSLPYPIAIKSISLPDGTSLRYHYDPAPAESAPSSTRIRRLVKVERLSAGNAVLDSVQYLYKADVIYVGSIASIRLGGLNGIIDNRGVRIATYDYDAAGRASLTERADGAGRYEVAYGPNGSTRVRTVTNPLDKVESYTFSSFSGAGPVDFRLTQVAGAASSNTPASTETLTYGSDTFVDSATDAESRVRTIDRDSRGRPTTLVEGDGTAGERTTTITWHSTFNVPTSIVRDGLTETRTYTSTGQLETVTLTDTTSHSVPYSTNGQTRTWTYDWDANGRLLSLDGPLAPDAQNNDDITSFTYDTAGNLLTATDAMGHVTTFDGHDANGRPGTMTDPNGIVTAYTYDALGRVETITGEHPSNSSLNTTTTIAYDAVGQVTGLTLPATDTLILDYDDAGRLTGIRAASGERWDFAYDAMGNVIRETVKRGDGSTSQQVTRAFDELGRIIRETTGVGHTARWGYDKVDNVISATSPNGHATTAAFDALDRVIETVAPDSGTTGLAYDDADNLLSYTDPIEVTTDFVHNGFGEVIQEVSPDRGTSTYWYDAAGRLIQSSDGRGQVVEYTYDYLGRITSKIPLNRPASEAIEYVWDTGGLSGSYEVGRLAKVIDGSGTTLFQYDHRGNLLAKQQTIGTTGAALLAYEYDLADRITQITYPSGRLVRYTYDSKGRVSEVQTKASASVGSWTTVASNYSYEPFAAVEAMTLGNGLAVANDWGDDGRLASRRLYRTSDGTSLSHLSYRYDADDNIAALVDNLNAANSAAYGYDEVGRLTLAVGDAAGAEQSYAYTSGSNRLASMTDASGTRTIGYDGRGNTVSEARPGSVTVAASYDGYGRLIEYDRSGAGAQDHAYNGLDDRVAMVTPTATRRYVYDADGRVLGEYGADAADVHAEFIWALPELATGAFGGDDGLGGYMPLAVAVPDGLGGIELNWIHGNHLGVPLVTTNAAGSAVTPSTAYLAPGFPGQTRVFPDLYYNRYRDYDPVTGRYIQADPIGLGGDPNPYLYALANPLNLTDPTGEVVPIILGFIIGAGLEYITNDCATVSDILLAGAIGGIGGGFGQLRFLRYGANARYRDTGFEWSHSIARKYVNRYTRGWLRRSLNRRGGYNGNWTRPPRHFKHDLSRYPQPDRRYPMGYHEMGKKWWPVRRLLDRIPDWAKISVGSGFVGSTIAGWNDKECQCD